MFLLSQLAAPNAILTSLLLNHTTGTLILLTTVNSIKIYKVEDLQNHPLIELELTYKIVAITKFKSSRLSNEIIVTLDSEFNINYIYIEENLKVKLKTMMTLSTEGQSQALECDPIITIDKYENPNWILIHTFNDSIQVLYFDPDYNLFEIFNHELKSKSKKRVRASKIWDLVSFPLGSIKVLTIEILHNVEGTLAILYRQYDSTISMRYLKIEAKDKPPKLIKQFAVFNERPSLVIPMQKGGFLSIAPGSIFYFPPPEVKTISISTSIKDKSIVVSQNEMYILKSITHTTLESFISYTTIDADRTLLISESGTAYMLYINVEFSSRQIVILNQLSLIELGAVTIPTNTRVHHIGGDLFFQASRISRSCLFQILPNSPHINIVSYIDSSPPILDITTVSNNGDLEVFTCQGGYHGSELRKYSSGPYTLRKSRSAKFSHVEYSSIEVLQNEVNLISEDNSGITVNLKDFTLKGPISPNFKEHKLACYKSKVDSYVLTRGAYYANDKAMIDGPFTLGITLSDCTGIIGITETNELKVLQGMNEPINYSKEGFDEITSIDCAKSDNSYFILITGLKGSIAIFKLSNGNVMELFQEVLEDEPCILSSAIIPKADKVVIILSLDSGTVYQMVFSVHQKKLTKVNSLKQSFNTYPYTIRKSKSNILLFNKNEILLMAYDMLSGFYCHSSFTSKESIVDLQFASHNQIVVGFDTKRIASFVMEKESQRQAMIKYNSIYSRDLFTKCMNIPENNHLVAISTSRNDSSSKLVLVDKRKFETVFECAIASHNGEFVDMCYFPYDTESLYTFKDTVPDFVVLCLSSSKEYPIYAFKVVHDEIMFHSNLVINGFKSFEEINLQSISYLGNNRFLVSGNVYGIIQLTIQEDDNFNLQIINESIGSSPSFIASQASLQNHIAIGDVVSGVYYGRMADDNDELDLSEIIFDNSHSYLTSLALVQEEVSKSAISGDAMGNIMISGVDFPENQAFFNLADQINKICPILNDSTFQDLTRLALIGTVSGALYMLSKIRTEEGLPDIFGGEIFSSSAKSLSKWCTLGRNRNEVAEATNDIVINGNNITNVLLDKRHTQKPSINSRTKDQYSEVHGSDLASLQRIFFESQSL
ncbi:uncharacterized protein J8A68_001765 [[Candida] subhashii]|uniref:RSE1/DDB1/CPSF1 first beta-propeller domain-containing protein n=1 Tax=[Candida] subhashii TaxID=561895 RepID=A0A8J5V3K2_9ASCO|nr:uncharacterized protein J8A68_001765 [[Candida] subhashii]KAG7664669.1 hypothetical protein J8A68_001765 [[Candida] subhashii]